MDNNEFAIWIIAGLLFFSLMGINGCIERDQYRTCVQMVKEKPAEEIAKICKR